MNMGHPSPWACKDFSNLIERLFFLARQGLEFGLWRLRARADAMVGHLIDTLKFLFQAFGQCKGIGFVAHPFKLLDFDGIGLGAVKQALQGGLRFVIAAFELRADARLLNQLHRR